MTKKSEVIRVNNEYDFQKHTASGTVVVQYSASWCGPCKEIAPVYQELAIQHAGQIKFLCIDCDENRELMRNHGVRLMPTFHFYIAGRKRSDVYIGTDRTALDRILEKLPRAPHVPDGPDLSQPSTVEEEDTFAIYCLAPLAGCVVVFIAYFIVDTSLFVSTIVGLLVFIVSFLFLYKEELPFPDDFVGGIAEFNENLQELRRNMKKSKGAQISFHFERGPLVRVP